MQKATLVKRIAQLGSLEYQKRCVVEGTAAEYVLLDELIETTIYASQHHATHPTLREALSPQQRDALIHFHDRVDALYGLIPWRDPDVSIADIVERSRTMRQIRDAANECLGALGESFATDDFVND
jgi:hypothetical protein